MSVAREAIHVLRKRGLTALWYGMSDALSEIASRAGVRGNIHEVRNAVVISTIAKSPMFEPSGSIEKDGQRYPVYRIKGS